MKTAARWKAGSASDPGLQRTINEDRVWLDETRGLFLVVDGLGGHAAGETAADTAVQVISQQLERPEQIKTAICAANNGIHRLAEEHAEWHGMACVLTLAVLQDDRVTVGHVGDSRLYLLWNGKLRKITSDHSPVGEQEDQGLLTEKEAMTHPRRNEIFRDVGSMLHHPDDDQFIDTYAFVLRDDAALLLCSDGLTDCITSAEIADIVERYDGDADCCAQRLVEAANAAGGKDNISVVFVAGRGFSGGQCARARHATTRHRDNSSRLPAWATYLLVFAVSIGVAFSIWRVTRPVITAVPTPVATASSLIKVSASDARGIIEALVTAQSGDTISVPPGEFLGPLLLKDGVSIVAKTRGLSIVHCDPAAPAEQGIAMVARSVHQAAVKGLRIGADSTHPLQIGVLLVDSSLQLEDLDISGAVYSGLRIEGDSKPELVDSFIHLNGGAGITIRDTSEPRLVHNQIMQNGLGVNALHPGVEVSPSAKPVLDGNVITHNGIEKPREGR